MKFEDFLQARDMLKEDIHDVEKKATTLDSAKLDIVASCFFVLKDALERGMKN